MRVFFSASHLEPGLVEIPLAPLAGLLDLGRIPRALDEVSERIAADLNESTFDSLADPNVMARKYAKLLSNLGNAIDAACGSRPATRPRSSSGSSPRTRPRCFEAARIEVAPAELDAERKAAIGPFRLVAGHDLSGGSSWQSLARKTGNIEADWFNGEIVLLGRLNGIPTPVNAAAPGDGEPHGRRGDRPGTSRPTDLLARL